MKKLLPVIHEKLGVRKNTTVYLTAQGEKLMRQEGDKGSDFIALRVKWGRRQFGSWVE